MELTSDYKARTDEVVDLFVATFTASEGAQEGQRIGTLVTGMFAQVEHTDIFVFLAEDEGRIVAAILFTRMTFAKDERSVFILSPVAVATAQQGKGIGQKLLKHGLAAVRDAGVDVALTYGDINFYAKAGFEQISEKQAAAPFRLSYPNGWLGQSLRSKTFHPLIGASRCVAPLSDPGLW